MIAIQQDEVIMHALGTPAVRGLQPSVDQLVSLEYLLLGDLRLLLEELGDPASERWLVAIIDSLLANRRKAGHSVQTAARSRVGSWHDASDRAWQESTVLYTKLLRLRDRVAHRAPFQLLANEIRCDLRDLMDT